MAVGQSILTACIAMTWSHWPGRLSQGGALAHIAVATSGTPPTLGGPLEDAWFLVIPREALEVEPWPMAA